MKSLLNSPLRHGIRLAAVLSMSAVALSASAADVGVSVSVNQPGFYGRVDIGNASPPPLIYTQPVIIEQRPIAMQQRPIYLRVPPGHERNWSRYCRQYQACGQPVLFVRPDYRGDHDGRWDDDRGRHDDDRHDRGRGHGHGRGHDKH